MIDRIYMCLSKRLNSGKEYFRICPPGFPLCLRWILIKFFFREKFILFDVGFCADSKYVILFEKYFGKKWPYRHLSFDEDVSTLNKNLLIEWKLNTFKIFYNRYLGVWIPIMNMFLILLSHPYWWLMMLINLSVIVSKCSIV